MCTFIGSKGSGHMVRYRVSRIDGNSIDHSLLLLSS